MPLSISRDLVETVVALACDAGRRILDFYESPIDVRSKDDRSPVTDADEAAEAIILPALHRIASDIPAVSEEAVSRGEIPSLIEGGRFWLVDPLDGTKEFIKRNGEFTVNIALIENGRPVFGVVHLPAMKVSYAGTTSDGAVRIESSGRANRIEVRSTPADGLTVLASRSHANDEALQSFLATRRVKECINAGSSLKFCRVAEGVADLDPRFGRTMEWDTAAGHAVLAAAGGQVCRLDGSPLSYGKSGFENPHFIASGHGQ